MRFPAYSAFLLLFVGRGRLALLLFTLSILLPTFQLRAQPFATNPPARIRLTIEDAVRRGLTLGEENLTAESQAREAATGRIAARANALPTLDALSSYTRNLSPIQLNLPPGFDLGSLGFGTPNTYTFSVVMNQPLFRPGAIRAVKIAEQYFQSSKDQATETRLSLVLRICAAYFDALLAERLAEISEAQIEQIEAQLKDIQLQRKAGNASDLDVSRVEVTRANVQPQVIASLNARDAAALNLKRLVNIEPKAQLDLADHLTTENFRAITDEEISLVVNSATIRRAAVKAARRLVEIRKQEVKQARSAYFPTLSAFGRVGEQALPSDLFPSRRDYQDDWAVGLNLSLPLFEGGRRRAQLLAAREKVIQAQLDLDVLLETITSEAEGERLRLGRAADLIATRARTTPIAARAFDLTALAYSKGTATHLDLTEARTNLRQARADEAQAIHDYYVAYLDFLRTVGVSPEEFGKVTTLSSHLPSATTDKKGKQK